MTTRTAHLVGSIGLGTVEEVFKVVGASLGTHLRRIPDGEVAGRRMWISWQYPVLRTQPFLVPDPSGAVRPTNRFPLLVLNPEAKADDIKFGELGYAREARTSYVDFVTARERGDIPNGVRFQVCLPTPFAVVSSVVVGNSLGPVEAAYERAMLAEVASLCRHIPHRDLCIQWDVCNELIIWDGQPTEGAPHRDVSRSAILERLSRLLNAIPDDVEAGIHLCYGDFAGRHFVEPRNAAAMVEFANAICAAATRSVTYVHMPVPIDRDDEEFHRPLRDLSLPPGTSLYLGIVHSKDGLEGARRRDAVASRYAPPYGVSTECGMGRVRSPETIRGLLKIHADLCEAGWSAASNVNRGHLSSNMSIPALFIGDFPAATKQKLAQKFDSNYFATMAGALSGLADGVAKTIRAIGTEVNQGAPTELLNRLPNLEVICCFGVGLDRVDLKTAKARNIPVTNTPGVVSEEVADFTIGLLLASARQIVLGDKFVRDGRWPSGSMGLGRSLRGKTLGIVGLGGIGRAVADRAVPFRMNICYHGPRKKADAPFTYVPDLAALARISDFFVVACKGSDETTNLVSPEIIADLRPTATLINVSRGNVVNERALVDALVKGRLGFAALDVFEQEPDVPRQLLALPNVVLQPHQAHAAAETRLLVGDLMSENLFAWFEGNPLPTRVI